MNNDKSILNVFVTVLLSTNVDNEIRKTGEEFLTQFIKSKNGRLHYLFENAKHLL